MSKNQQKRKLRRTSKSHSVLPGFLVKTYEIIENPEYKDLISWNKEGNAFIVKNTNEFAGEILPKYFKHGNFASFVRQLNMYDFHKIKHENNKDEFKHKYFKRGQKHLLSEIKRKIPKSMDSQPVHVSTGTKTRSSDVDKYKEQSQTLMKDLNTLKGRQTELDKTVQTMYTQNSKLSKENKVLWQEMAKNKDKYERKTEKLMMFICSMLNPSTNKNALEAFISKRGLPASDSAQLADEIKAIQNGEQLKVEEGESNKNDFPAKFSEDDLDLLDKKTKKQATRKPLDRRTKRGRNYAKLNAENKVLTNSSQPTTDKLENGKRMFNEADTEDQIEATPQKFVKTENNDKRVPLSSMMPKDSITNVLDSEMDQICQPSLSRMMSLNESGYPFRATSTNMFPSFNEMDIFSSPKPFNHTKKEDAPGLENDMLMDNFMLNGKDDGMMDSNSLEPHNSNLFDDKTTTFSYNEDAPNYLSSVFKQ